jgi:DNA repair protein RadC
MNYATALVSLPLVCEARGGSIRTPEDALGVCADLATLAQEAFHVLCLNTRNKLVNRHMVSLGTVNSTSVSVSLCMRCAVIDNAVSLVAVHNHPSGQNTPSAEDIDITRKLVEAGKILGIRVLDHIIVGRDPATGAATQLSLREKGLVEFE